MNINKEYDCNYLIYLYIYDHFGIILFIRSKYRKTM